MYRKKFFPIAAAAFTAVMILTACAQDGDDEAEQATDLGESYQELTVALANNTNIAQASDDAKDMMTASCGDLQDGIDNDDLDDFCSDLGDAVDDEDQAKYDDARTRFAALDPQIRAEIGQQIGEAVDENADDDDPLQGGDEGDDAEDSFDEPDVDNPLDDDGDGANDDGADNPLGGDDAN